MKPVLQSLILGSCLALTVGCSVTRTSNTFTLSADLPPDFAYVATVTYVPAQGQSCTLRKGDNMTPQFNREWRTEYKPDAQIEIRRTSKGCELVVYRIELDINATYGKDRGDFGGGTARVAVRSELPGEFKGTFNAAGVSEFTGQCQWLFRTIGPKRYITKILDCKKTDEQGSLVRGHPFAAYTLDQLPGKTVRLKIKLAEEEIPYFGRSWLKTSGGWKPCIETKETFRCQTPPTFTDFRMPDGRRCEVYPSCIENKEVTP